MSEHESLLSLAEYLELPLSIGESVIMMQECDACCAIYVGNASKDQSLLVFHGMVNAAVARESRSANETAQADTTVPANEKHCTEIESAVVASPPRRDAYAEKWSLSSSQRRSMQSYPRYGIILCTSAPLCRSSYGKTH
jgi:hypothetical protein